MEFFEKNSAEESPYHIHHLMKSAIIFSWKF